MEILTQKLNSSPRKSGRALVGAPETEWVIKNEVLKDIARNLVTRPPEFGGNLVISFCNEQLLPSQTLGSGCSTGYEGGFIFPLSLSLSLAIRPFFLPQPFLFLSPPFNAITLE